MTVKIWLRGIVMGNISADPDGYRPSDVVSRLRRCIKQGCYGIDYTIIPRDKNEALLERYIMTEEDRIGVLLQLTVEEYDGWDMSDNPDFPNDLVYLFHHEIELMQRGEEDSQSRIVKLYIKVTWTKPEGVLIIISFHE